jgi:uncharacterized protein with ParB-like and HNH nuclease domain
MEAREKELKFLTTEGKVIIPFFQRTYVWEQENWENLLEGLFSKPYGHFLGSIILKQIPVRSGETKKLEVVDGQQRLTTLSILIKVLYDLFSPELQKTTENVMRQILFSKPYETSSEYFVKIEHSQVDKEAYERVIKAKIDGNPPIDIEKIDEKSHRIEQCYKFFYKKLRDYSERESLFNKILDPNNKMLVVIDLVEGKDDEQAIFDTLNTAGVRLTTAEIVKNALYQKIIEKSDKEYAVNFYKNTWEKTFLSDEDTVRYWEREKLTGRLKRDNLEILLHSVAIIKGFFDPDKHTLSDLSKLYKEKIQKLGKEELENFVNEIIYYAEIYRDKFPDFDKSTAFTFEDSVIRLFHILEELEISTFHPFILFVFKQYGDNENEIINKLANLEKFIVRRMIARQETKNYNKYCKEFIKDPNSILEKLKETTDEDISNGLRKISNKNATLLLFWVELYRRHKGTYDVKELKFTYSLEHIMPQKWEEHWKDIPEKYKPDGSKMTEEEAKKDRYEKVYWIGNMTLLRSSLNSALRNYTFEKKMEGEGRKKGIKTYADLSITKDDIVEPYNKGDKNWDENKIEERTNKLGKEIKEIWNV